MSRSRSRRQILLLDCCYSGAFKQGMLAKGDKRVGAGEQLEGQGRIVLTASDALQYSFEGGHVARRGRALGFHAHARARPRNGRGRPGSRWLLLSRRRLQLRLRPGFGRAARAEATLRWVTWKAESSLGANPRPLAAKLPPELRETRESAVWVRLVRCNNWRGCCEQAARGWPGGARRARLRGGGGRQPAGQEAAAKCPPGCSHCSTVSQRHPSGASSGPGRAAFKTGILARTAGTETRAAKATRCRQTRSVGRGRRTARTTRARKGGSRAAGPRVPGESRSRAPGRREGRARKTCQGANGKTAGARPRRSGTGRATANEAGHRCVGKTCPAGRRAEKERQY